MGNLTALFSYLPVMETFDHLSGLTKKLSTMFSDYFYHPQLPCNGELEQEFKCLCSPPSLLPPTLYCLQLNIDRYSINVDVHHFKKKLLKLKHKSVVTKLISINMCFQMSNI